MTLAFTTIGLIGRFKKVTIADTLTKVIDCLSRYQTNIIIEQTTAEQLETSLTTMTAQSMAKHCDLIITVGGDGNLLNAARIATQYNTPILGINRGRFGFLTDIRPNDIDELVGAIIHGQFSEEKRFLLQVQVEHEDEKSASGLALNDIVISATNTAQMLSFEISVDDDFMCSQQSDGLIISTPTGSTAYALSAGGPIIHPGLNAIVMIPMFAHGLNYRPIVLNASKTIIITNPDITTAIPRISCDGQDYLKTKPNSIIKVAKADKLLRLIHPLNYNYFESLRGKLHWGQRLRSSYDDN